MNYLPCPKCGSRNTTEANYDFLDHIVCEYDIVCADCEVTVNHWAYGNVQDVEKYTELWKMQIDSFKYRAKRFLKKLRKPNSK
jgi:transcription elongation factor Elf1